MSAYSRSTRALTVVALIFTAHVTSFVAEAGAVANTAKDPTSRKSIMGQYPPYAQPDRVALALDTAKDTAVQAWARQQAEASAAQAEAEVRQKAEEAFRARRDQDLGSRETTGVSNLTQNALENQAPVVHVNPYYGLPWSNMSIDMLITDAENDSITVAGALNQYDQLVGTTTVYRNVDQTYTLHWQGFFGCMPPSEWLPNRFFAQDTAHVWPNVQVAMTTIYTFDYVPFLYNLAPGNSYVLEFDSAFATTLQSYDPDGPDQSYWSVTADHTPVGSLWLDWAYGYPSMQNVFHFVPNCASSAYLDTLSVKLRRTLPHGNGFPVFNSSSVNSLSFRSFSLL